MNDHNDEAQNYALMVLAGVIALVLGGVLFLAARTGLAGHRSGTATAATTSTAPAAVTQALAGDADARLYFALDSAALPADANDVLVKLADTAREQSGKVVLISGFHDASGDAAHNAELARQRAEAVRHALEADGVPIERLVLDKPNVNAAGGDPKEARRVEMRLR